jgi:hypothetical protein
MLDALGVAPLQFPHGPGDPGTRKMMDVLEMPLLGNGGK